ncbi:MAG: S-adenosylmethionine:tRNA ribosyltransferase-isomerase [Acidimicrobiaceae bacterium]|nr:S-adenosylmethionine:tRNA ribosyltransferase-isomerase [Acidimicrobiaceae bacterium]
MTAIPAASLLDSYDFVLPAELEASEPAEARGLTRDAVRLMVASRSTNHIDHAHFSDLPRFLKAGDLVVINVSSTLPAAVDATTPDGDAVTLHLSTPLPAGGWVVELRCDGGARPFFEGRPGLRLALPGGADAELLTPYPLGTDVPRLWAAVVRVPGTVHGFLARYGRPIRYAHVPRPWPLSAYQNVYGLEPGSAEMASAGRGFTADVLTALVARGIGVAPITLHAGVSSQEAGEPPFPEPYRVPADTARRVNAAHEWGGRVVAIGTTVVRALESVADDRGHAHPGQGWTDHVVTPDGGVRVVDGLLTGWHEPRASHLAMLEAIAGRPLLEVSYQAALDDRYLWHEFGDAHLVLP